MFELALAAHPLRPKLKGKGNIASVTVGFEFEFICPTRLWYSLPDLIKEHLGKVGAISKLYADHKNRQDKLTSWHITGDSSIKGYEDTGAAKPEREEGESDSEYNERCDEVMGETAVELVSPITQAADISKTLMNVAKVLAAVEARTNESCGLHITLGNSAIKNRFDPIKFALFLGDDKILAHYKRLCNDYAESTLSGVHSRIRQSNSDDFYEGVGIDKPDESDYDEDADWGDDGKWGTDASAQQEVLDTPYEIMRDRLLSHHNKGFRTPDRAGLLDYLANIDTRYQSVNIQNMEQNLVEYRAIGDYLKASTPTDDMNKVANIAKRAVGALLVAVGDIDSPVIDKQYRTMLYARFKDEAPDQPGVRHNFTPKTEVGPGYTKSYHDGKLEHIRNDITIPVADDVRLYVKTNAERLGDSELKYQITIIVSTGSYDKACTMDIVGRMFATANKTFSGSKPSVYTQATPKPTSTAFLSHAAVVSLYKMLYKLFNKPTNPAFTPLWQGLCLLTRDLKTTAHESLSLQEGCRGVFSARDALIFKSEEVITGIREVLAKIVATRLDRDEYKNKRYATSTNPLIQKANAGLDEMVQKRAVDLAFGPTAKPLIGVREYVLPLLWQRIKNPYKYDLDVAAAIAGIKKQGSDNEIVYAAFHVIGAAIALGYFASAQKAATVIKQILDGIGLKDLLSSRLHNDSAPAGLAAVAGFIVAPFERPSIFIGQFTMQKIESMAKHYADLMSMPLDMSRAEPYFDRYGKNFTELDYVSIWRELLPALRADWYQNVGPINWGMVQGTVNWMSTQYSCDQKAVDLFNVFARNYLK